MNERAAFLLICLASANGLAAAGRDAGPVDVAVDVAAADVAAADVAAVDVAATSETGSLSETTQAERRRYRAAVAARLAAL